MRKRKYKSTLGKQVKFTMLFPAATLATVRERARASGKTVCGFLRHELAMSNAKWLATRAPDPMDKLN